MIETIAIAGGLIGAVMSYFGFVGSREDAENGDVEAKLWRVVFAVAMTINLIGACGLWMKMLGR